LESLQGIISRVKRKYFKFRLLFWLSLVFIFLTIGVLVAYTQEKAVTPNITIIDILENTIIAMLGEYPDNLTASQPHCPWTAASVVRVQRRDFRGRRR
jgi:hypothetical protein